MIIDLLNDLDASGTLEQLYKCGLISHKAIIYREIYLAVDIQQKVHRKELADAVHLTADKFKVSTDTVYRAIRTLSKP